MYQALIIFHVLVAIGIISLVLLQQGRGADAGAAFGSGASGTVFGARGAASFLTRCTAVLAGLFFASSLGLAMLGDTRVKEEGFMDETVIEQSIPDMPTGGLPSSDGAISDLPEPAIENIPIEGGEQDVGNIELDVPMVSEDTESDTTVNQPKMPAPIQ